MQSERGIWDGEEIARLLRLYYGQPPRTLYVGVMNDLTRRVYEHRNKLAPGFTSKYNVSKLVYFESSDDVTSAIAREKQIKAGRRSKKVTLLENTNPYWNDLASEWFDHSASPDPSLRSG